MKSKRTIAFLNFVSSSDVEENITQVSKLLLEAKDKGADWVFLPEMWTHQTACIDAFKDKSRQASEIVLERLQIEVKKLALTCFAGSWTESDGIQDEKFFNTQYVLSPSAEVIAKYRKVHLFKMDDGSSDPYRETKKFIPGDQHCTLEHNSWNIGLSTCFDIRFPEFFVKMHQDKPLDMITVPSAFLRATGKDHWQVLLQARAIENQSFVIASNRIGPHPDPRIESYFGHSMVIDPWGKVILDTGDQTGVFLVDIDPDRLDQVRKLLPLHKVKAYKKKLG